jgi:hypothetical protein
LDLSQRATFDATSSSSSSSIISAGFQQQQQQQQRRSGEIRRSASSVSYYKKSNADVNDHFQRTFSGKWPRRQPSLRAHIPASGGRTSKPANVIGIGATKEGSIGETVVEGEAEGEGRDMPMPMEEGNRASTGPPKMEVVVEQQQQQPQQQQQQPVRPKSR